MPVETAHARRWASALPAARAASLKLPSAAERISSESKGGVERATMPRPCDEEGHGNLIAVWSAACAGRELTVAIRIRCCCRVVIRSPVMLFGRA